MAAVGCNPDALLAATHLRYWPNFESRRATRSIEAPSRSHASQGRKSLVVGRRSLGAGVSGTSSRRHDLARHQPPGFEHPLIGTGSAEAAGPWIVRRCMTDAARRELASLAAAAALPTGCARSRASHPNLPGPSRLSRDDILGTGTRARACGERRSVQGTRRRASASLARAWIHAWCETHPVQTERAQTSKNFIAGVLTWLTPWTDPTISLR